MKAVIDGLVWICAPLETSFKVEPGLCLIACQSSDGMMRVVDVLRFDDDGPESEARFCDPVCREAWRRHCLDGRLWACFYPMPPPGSTREDREGLEQMLRAEHRGQLCGQ